MGSRFSQELPRGSASFTLGRNALTAAGYLGAFRHGFRVAGEKGEGGAAPLRGYRRPPPNPQIPRYRAASSKSPRKLNNVKASNFVYPRVLPSS